MVYTPAPSNLEALESPDAPSLVVKFYLSPFIQKAYRLCGSQALTIERSMTIQQTSVPLAPKWVLSCWIVVSGSRGANPGLPRPTCATNAAEQRGFLILRVQTHQGQLLEGSASFTLSLSLVHGTWLSVCYMPDSREWNKPQSLPSRSFHPPSNVGDVIAKGTSGWKGLRMIVKLTTQSWRSQIEGVPSTSALMIRTPRAPPRDRKRQNHIKQHHENVTSDDIFNLVWQM